TSLQTFRTFQRWPMRIRTACVRQRRGVVAPLTAILVVFLMGMVAFAVDIGYVVLVRQELQNAGDAASLARASKLLDPSLLKGSPNQSQAMANARDEATRFAQANTAGNVALGLRDNASNDQSGDIVCGFLANPQDQSQSMTYTQFPNSVRVTV